MPFLKIQTNVTPNDKLTLIKAASAIVAEALGKPERYVMVEFHLNENMVFAGSNEPLAYLELKSIGLPSDRTTDLSAKLCDFINTETAINQDRIYIEFADAQRNMWGWNSATF
jgi:phenylpyruvate tautomerase